MKSIIKEIDIAIKKASLTNYDLSMSKDILESFVDMAKRILESIQPTFKKFINLGRLDLRKKEITQK